MVVLIVVVLLFVSMVVM